MHQLQDANIPQILLVEDDPGDVMLIEESIEDAQIPIGLSHVDNGVSALQYLRKQGKYSRASTPNMIFLDLNLPKKDGRAVLREIKRDIELRKIPVLVLTTSEATEDINMAYDLGANCYVPKPVDLGAFDTVTRCIENFWFTYVKFPAV